MMPLDFPFHVDSRGRTAQTSLDEHIRDHALDRPAQSVLAIR